MNRKALTRAVIIGTVLQLIMVVAGHYVPVIKNQGFAVGGMAISLIAGLLYARAAGSGWGDSLLGAAIAGGACALIGIAVSVLLKDVPVMILIVGTLSSVVTGVIGGAIGKVIPRPG
ncbi:MAG: hypothetical protein JWP35_4759 [Caulobacter sp.]|nr:hypothetical protein [Caulobacter sp.]